MAMNSFTFFSEFTRVWKKYILQVLVPQIHPYLFLPPIFIKESQFIFDFHVF